MTRAWVVRFLIVFGCLVAVAAAPAASTASAADAFTPAPGSPAGTQDNPISVAASPDGSLLAVANMNSDDVSVYSVASSGALTPLPGSPYQAGRGPTAVAFDPASSVPLLEVANGTDGTIEPFIDVSGVFLHGTPVSSGASGGPESLSFDRSGTLLAAGISDGKVALFDVGQDGEPSLIGGAQQTVAISLPDAVALSPDGATLATGDGANDHVDLYAVNPAFGVTGQLSSSPLDVGTGGDALNLGFSPDGSTLAVSARNADSVSLFDTSTYAMASSVTVSSPTKLAYAPTGRLLTVSSGSTAVVYAVGGGDALSPVAGSPYTVAPGSTSSDAGFARGGGVLAGLDEYGDTLSTFTVSAPDATISSPGAGATYPAGRSVATSFSCSDAPDAPGIASCTDSNGSGDGSGTLDTSTVGRHTYTATATSIDGQTSTSTVAYNVAAAPTATITSPASGATYTLNQSVTAAFSCQDGTGGPGISSCTGSTADGAALATGSSGTFTFKVTATSADGGTTTETVSYTVTPASAPAANTLTLELGSTAPTVLIAHDLIWGNSNDSVSVPGVSAPDKNEFTVVIDQSDNDASSVKALLKPEASWDTARLALTGSDGSTLTYTFKSVRVLAWASSGTAATRRDTIKFSYGSVTVPTSPATKVRIPQRLNPVHARLRTFSGTIVHLIRGAQSFVLAESDGQLVAIHSSDPRIAPGKLVTAKVTTLLDGTYRARHLTFAHRTRIALLQGSVTFVSKAGNFFVLSDSGTSIGITRTGRHAKTPPLGKLVKILVVIRRDELVQQGIRRLRRAPGIICVEGQFIGLTTEIVNGKPQLALEITSTDQTSTDPSKQKHWSGTQKFPVTDTQSESVASAVASGTHVLKLCGRREGLHLINGGKPGTPTTGNWSDSTSGFIDSSKPTKLF